MVAGITLSRTESRGRLAGVAVWSRVKMEGARGVSVGSGSRSFVTRSGCYLMCISDQNVALAMQWETGLLYTQRPPRSARRTPSSVLNGVQLHYNTNGIVRVSGHYGGILCSDGHIFESLVNGKIRTIQQ